MSRKNLQKPGKSFQAYGTPADFLAAVRERFGPLDVDLACTHENAKARHGHYVSETDSLCEPWADLYPDSLLWLNPPFGDIDPWAEKCKTEGARMRAGHILLLTPASIGSNWYADHVHGNALVLGLAPRMTFDGTPPNPRTGKVDPYPKDLMLSVFGRGVAPGLACWRWKEARAVIDIDAMSSAAERTLYLPFAAVPAQ